MELANAKILVLTGSNTFAAKKLLAVDDITSNYLVYSPLHYDKQEWLNEQHFRTREEAKVAVFEYIWIFYNRKRIHEANGYLTPEEYYQKHEKDLKAA